jgi:hypothetical protein
MAQDYQTAISLVSVGIGISVVPKSVSQAERPGVKYRDYEGCNPGTSLSLNYRRDNPDAASIQFPENRPKIRTRQAGVKVRRPPRGAFDIVPISQGQAFARTCHPYRPVGWKFVSAESLLENGNFCGLGWRLLAILAKVVEFRRPETHSKMQKPRN